MSLEKALQENTEVMRELIATLSASGGAAGKPETTEKETTTRTRRSRSSAKGEAASKYTAEQVKAAAVKVKDELGTAAAKKLIKDHGAPELSKLKPESYEAFVKDAEALLAGADDGDDDDDGDL